MVVFDPAHKYQRHCHSLFSPRRRPEVSSLTHLSVIFTRTHQRSPPSTPMKERKQLHTRHLEMSTQHLLLHSNLSPPTPNGSHHRRLSPRTRRSIDAIANPNQRARMQAERNGLPIGNGGQRGGYGMPQRMAHSPPKNKSMQK